MKGMAHRSDYSEVYLVLPPRGFDNREIRRGIYEQALPERHWIFAQIDQSPDAIRRLPVNQHTAGIIGRFGEEELAKAARSLGIPAINIHGGKVMSGLPVVGPDFVEVGCFAGRYLGGLGIPNLAFYGLGKSDFSRAHRTGFVEEVSGQGFSPHVFEPEAEEKHLEKRSGENPTKKWLCALPKPIAVFCPEDVFAHEIGFMCWQLGLRVPQDVAILGTNNDELFCLGMQPALSSLRLPWQEIGKRAAMLLADMLVGAPAPDDPIRIGPPDLVLRQSSTVIHCHDEMVEKALRYLSGHLHDFPGMETLSRHCGASRRKLEKRFRAVLDRSPLQEFNRIRSEEIKRQLRENPKTIEEIADEMGFSSAIYLSEFFQRETGMRPGAYRKSFRQMVATRS